ncbi:hypothetical protein LV457_02750 [Mycobacterium sp. MYCO198283]|uniref:hypothetical protein n=1 Tax=Mycobacterium sp. MYCO198283 TaxID=2883505 RepID=UPI001E33290F|nr:hypothetical protein [Mycobacterium sp. MYCO198283]MCG5431209.1 hypothetical protein [Mycobacterium sp. MYCO198283]
MSHELPPHLQSMVDQADAFSRDVLTSALTNYRTHADSAHGGNPSPCGQALVALGAFSRLDRMSLANVFAYAVERIFVLERERADRGGAAQ